MNVIPIPDIHSFTGDIPSGYELTVYESGTNPMHGFVLYGFDEVDLYRSFGISNPKYCFTKS